MLALLDIYMERMNHHLHTREALLQQCAESGNEELLSDLAAVAQRINIDVMTFCLSCYCSVATVKQCAALWVACYPWCPSLSALHASLLRIRAERVAAAAAAGGRRGSAGAAGSS